MTTMTISEVAGQIGLRASAIRYYEKIGILRPAERASGQRRFDLPALYRLAMVRRARQLGFTLTEIRQLFFGFRKAAPATERWKKLSERKLAQLSELAAQIDEMQQVLERLRNCQCDTLEQCGKGMYLKLTGGGRQGAKKGRSSTSRMGVQRGRFKVDPALFTARRRAPRCNLPIAGG